MNSTLFPVCSRCYSLRLGILQRVFLHYRIKKNLQKVIGNT